MLISIVGCVALVGTAGKAVDETVTEASASDEASQQVEEDRNAPREVTPGKAAISSASSISSRSPGCSTRSA
jgi:hypothetical protein